MYSLAGKGEKILRSNYRALYSPLMDLGWALTLWGSARVHGDVSNCLECKNVIGDFFRWANCSPSPHDSTYFFLSPYDEGLISAKKNVL